MIQYGLGIIGIPIADATLGAIIAYRSVAMDWRCWIS